MPGHHRKEQQVSPSGGGLATTVACNGCRRAKLRCSRDRPTCSHCLKLGQECIYECKRTKPGIKVGAIDHIQKRLDAIEHRLDQRQSVESFLADRHHKSTLAQPVANPVGCPAESIIALLASELPKLVAASNTTPVSSVAEETRKRRKVESTSDDGIYPRLPTFDVIQACVEIYFSHVHSWIPMLHQDRFRERLGDPQGFTALQLVVQAILITTSRFLPDEHRLDDVWSSEATRQRVVVASMESNAIEGLQALIILIHHDIGSGNGARISPMIATLARMVEILQLAADSEDQTLQACCPPLTFLDSAKDWTEQEERRRVFWNVFLLDRFYLISCGWHTSLASLNVHQPLPCEGIFWRKMEAVETPSLGIWDKANDTMYSLRSIGNMQEGPPIMQNHRQLEEKPGPYDSLVTNIGAFAYCVEATESMGMVTTHFLQYRFNIQDARSVNSWLARFKEIDLRLLHWKMFLPQKWKSHVPAQPSRMDPNLTLAHLTHNASTILLHQVIAWPPSAWTFAARLPSLWSSETCRSAGIEISTITRKYLDCTPASLPVASAFAFCVYIAARMMLIHWRHDPENSSLDEFWAMKSALSEMSSRWNGGVVHQGHHGRRDLALAYAECLARMHLRCQADAKFQIGVMDYTWEVDSQEFSQVGSPGPPAATGCERHDRNEKRSAVDSLQRHPQDGGQHLEPSSTMIPQISSCDGSQPIPGDQHTLQDQGSEVTEQSLSLTQEEFVLEDYFMDLDRVISFNDGSLFSAELENGGW